MAALAQPVAVAATAINGAPIDPQNLIADDLEAEALASYARNSAHGAFRGQEIVIVDYRLPSSTRRMYVVNLMTGAVQPHYVSHGRGSDPGHTKVAVRFGDVPESGMSSLGAYRGGPRYQSPSHGPAMRLFGLDATNRSAYDRLIVFHTAPYFDPANGKFGRSLGCFVVTAGDRAHIYDVIADGGFLYAGPVCLGSGKCGKPAPRPDILVASAEPERAAPLLVAAAAPPPAPAPAKAAPAKAKPAAPAPIVLAAVAPAAPVHAVPAVMSDAMPTPRVKPRLEAEPVTVAFNAPIPIAKPALDSDEQLAAVAELLARRRAEPAAAEALVATAALDVPLPIAKPAAVTGDALVAAADDTDGIPVPQLKPALDTADDTAIVALIAASVPGQADLALDEGVPLPQAKPDLFGVQEAEAAAPAVPETEAGEIPVPAAKPAGLRRVADAGPTP